MDGAPLGGGNDEIRMTKSEGLKGHKGRKDGANIII